MSPPRFDHGDVTSDHHLWSVRSHDLIQFARPEVRSFVGSRRTAKLLREVTGCPTLLVLKLPPMENV